MLHRTATTTRQHGLRRERESPSSLTPGRVDFGPGGGPSKAEPGSKVSRPAKLPEAGGASILPQSVPCQGIFASI